MSDAARLLVAADADATDRLQRALAEQGLRPTLRRVDDPAALSAALAGAGFDLVVVDARRGLDPLRALAELRARGHSTPVIALADDDPDAAAQQMRAGLRDVIAGGHPGRLAQAVARELGEAEARAERRGVQEQLVLSDRMASLGLLAAGIAHELNNPLAALMFSVEHALRRVGGGEVAEDLREALACAERIRQIVRDVRVFSRPEEQRGATVDVHEVLDSSVRMAWNEIRHRGRLVREYGEVPRALGDEARLGQVFLNLIVNAAQALAPERFDRNAITVRTAREPSGRIRVEVADTGEGMPPETLARAFEPFFTTKPAGAGTGLGLAISRRLLTALGGEIDVHSRPGEGTTFVVHLPAAPSAPPPPPPPPDDSTLLSVVPPRRRTHAREAADPRPVSGDMSSGPAHGPVLVLDDDPAVGRMLTRLLGRRHAVTALEHAPAALERLAAGARYAAILCDLMMPTMPGRVFYREVQAIDPEQARRIVFMTGGAFTPEAQAFLESVPNACVDKPFAVPTLIAAIDALG